MYFVYFTNILRICIFVYLLTISFVRVLIVYFKNIVYSCITINFTISYVKLHIFITFHAVQLQYILLLLIWIYTLYEFACTCAVYSTFLNASTDTISYAVGDQIFLGRGKGENPVMKILLKTGIICNFIITSTVYNRKRFGSSNHKNIFRILGNIKTNF